jgi:selenocysteine-specific elongation factor
MAAEAAPQLTLGTAGHIDHGKTALVEALTGVNTDRLEEERRRGISIALGYARLDLPGGIALSVVDVPGHERLVRTMVAGATGIDLFMLVVAADDGVMPQTLEHLAVLRALGVDGGVVALTKCDAADADSVELARVQVASLGVGEPVEVSARTGEGLDRLRGALAEAARRSSARSAETEPDQPAVLHVDRVFSLHGIGTVATGTLWSGSIAPGQRLEVLPSGAETRVRSVEVHGTRVSEAVAGGRVALNLTGPGRAGLEPGCVVASMASGLRPSYRLDVELRLERTAESLGGERVQVHHGTRDVAARVVELGDGLAQLRLEDVLVARSGDRVVIRSISRPDTVGGGMVVDPNPRRRGPATAAAPHQEAEAEIPESAPEQAACEPSRRAMVVLALLEADGAAPRAPAAIAEALGIAPPEIERLLGELVDSGLAVRLGPQVYFARSALEPLRTRTVELARRRGELTLPELRTQLGTSRKYAQALLEHLDATGVTVRHGARHVLRRPREIR